MPHQFTPAGNNEPAQSLYLAIRDHTIRLPDNPQLADELLHIQIRETQPGIYRIDHQHGRHGDIAITAAMATWWHQQQRTWRPRAIQLPVATKESVVGHFDHPGVQTHRW